ncbi:hypothetical protein [Hwangdonia seohaensis]|uniref:Uncharacterized protein n=1 Tax=Hwangdonia seohaensis TaxID=1240727 RepID=A0ABW3RCN7_9FLAO|nr:hypothetical protein [Hwangdonia seohaensis]
MGGEGSMAAANNSLKNNRNLLKKKRKGSLAGSYGNLEMAEFPEATPQQLLEIEKKIRNKNKQARIKQLIIFAIFMLVFLSFIYYLIN